MIAHCDWSGHIIFSRHLPKGEMQIAEGRAKLLRAAVSAIARHAYDGENLLVPGMPEADSLVAAKQALDRFIDRVAANRAWREA